MADKGTEEEGESKGTIERELVKGAYKDLGRPAAREFGEMARTIAAALNTRFAKMRLWTQERNAWEEEQSAAIARKHKARGVPLERIQAPNSRILMPIVLAMAMMGEDEELDIRELYHSLLATSMDEATADLAHPAYPAIIAQLLPDEARILKWLATKGTMYCYYVMKGKDKILDDVWLVNEDAGCTELSAVKEQIGNLNRLGLTTYFEYPEWQVRISPEVAREAGAGRGTMTGESLSRALAGADLVDGPWEPHVRPRSAMGEVAELLRRQPEILEALERSFARGEGEPILRRGPSNLTYLGRSLCNACVVEPGTVADRVTG